VVTLEASLNAMSESPPPIEAPLPADGPPPDVLLRQRDERARAFEESLVLCAEAIPHRVEPGETGFSLWVRAEDAARAEASLAAWQSENRVEPIAPKRRWDGATPAPIFAVLCVVSQLAIGDRDDRVGWFIRGTADAQAIRHGELWRCATALTLHADFAHALGNAVCGFILIDALARRLGPAWAAWLTLIAGIAGNWLTAHAVHGSYFSIGASTAVFGALGALTASQMISRERRSFLTLGAGVALLGVLGSGKGPGTHTDVFAHLFGALVGFVIGLLAGLLQREAPEEKALQPLLAIAALIPLGAAWWLALR
jgi:rhomboid protease GluP